MFNFKVTKANGEMRILHALRLEGWSPHITIKKVEILLSEMPVNKLKEAKDFAASIEDVQSFKLLRRVIMVKEALQ